MPALSLATIEHRSALEGMETGQLVARLAELVKVRPELREALGGRLVNAEEPG